MEKILQQDTSVLEVINLNGSNITNCECKVISSSFFTCKYDGVMLPYPKAGDIFSVVRNLVKWGNGTNWVTESIIKLK